jgi:hypothetical protein
MDWNSEANESNYCFSLERKVNRVFGEGIKSLENRYKKDDDFISECRSRLNRDVLESSDTTHEIMWDVIQQRKFEETNYSTNFTFEGFCVRPKV